MRQKDIAVFTATNWAGSLHQVFIRLATCEAGIGIPVIVCMRFLLGAPFCYWVGKRAEGPGFYRSKNWKAQASRSCLMLGQTLAFTAGTTALKNVALANAITLIWPAFAVLRCGFVHQRRIPPFGWACVALCMAGAALLAAASGMKSPYACLGIALLGLSMYIRVLLMERAEKLSSSGDSRLCTWFWSMTAGFALAVVAVIGISMSTCVDVSIRLPELQAGGVALLGAVAISATATQLGFALPNSRSDTMSLAPWGLTQVIPAMAFQTWVDDWRLPSIWTFAGIAVLLAASYCGLQGQKLMRRAA